MFRNEQQFESKLSLRFRQIVGRAFYRKILAASWCLLSGKTRFSQNTSAVRPVVVRRLFLIICLAVVFPAIPRAESGTAPILQEIDLASDSAWQLNINGGPWRPIKVPGGGWNSDQQSPTLDFYQRSKVEVDSKRGNPDFKYAEYRREIEIPAQIEGRVVLVRFGAVNYVAEVFLDGHLVRTHRGAMMPFEADITPYVKSGGRHVLSVKCFGLTGQDVQCPSGFTYWKAHEGSKFALGITKSVTLAVLPEVYLKDLMVRTSVAKRQFSCEVLVCNSSSTRRTVTVSGMFSPWNRERWDYPQLPDVQVEVEPKSEKNVVLGPVAWELGPASYWWPNKPFREDYSATLHNLAVVLREKGQVINERCQRFGYVEYGEGPYYYTINGLRINHISDGTPESGMSEFDCYSVSPAFLPPSATSKGCPESWKRYMRIGMCTYRTHQSTPTPYMMDAADETGMMLVPETGIRWQTAGADQPLEPLTQSVRDLARVCRNHPCIAMYSLSNEAGVNPALVDAIAEVDDSRPLVFEVNHMDGGRIDGKRLHAYKMVHYWTYPKPSRSIFGMGEFAWRTDGMALFADGGKDMRINDLAYFAGWDWINYWPNFLEGMNHDKHGWKLNNAPDRTDGVNGWGSHLVDYVQRAFHPYALMWPSLENANAYSPKWPEYTQIYGSGEQIREKVVMFNDSFQTNPFTLTWEAHWDNVAGPLYRAGKSDGIVIEPGFHATQTITFPLPVEVKNDRRLFIRLASWQKGEIVCSDDRFSLCVTPTAGKVEEATIVSHGVDSETGGRWRQRYGKEGYQVLFAEEKVPGYATVRWLKTPGKSEFKKKSFAPGRALEYFVNQGGEEGQAVTSRAASPWVGVSDTPLRMKLDVGPHPHRVAFYCYHPGWGGNVMISVAPEHGGALPVTVKVDAKRGEFAIFTLKGSVIVTSNLNSQGV